MARNNLRVETFIEKILLKTFILCYRTLKVRGNINFCDGDAK